MLSRCLQMLVLAYRFLLSPLSNGCCRYAPSCSEYAIEALKQHGALKGTSLIIKRIVRCHPWGGSGYDPVPPKQQHTCSSHTHV